MAHKVGALELPALAPAGDESMGDPGLDVLAAFFAAVLRSWLKTAWEARVPGEPIVRTISTHDPEEVDFSFKHLPLLSVWRDNNARPQKFTDTKQEAEATIRILWMPPPATQRKNSRRHSFFAAFDKVVSLAVANERDPSWIHADDATNPNLADVDAQAAWVRANQAAVAYGSDVLEHAGLSWWRLARVERIPVDIPMGGGVERHPGYLATLTVAEVTETDTSVFGVSPFAVRFELQDKTGDHVREDAAVPIPE